MASRYGREPNSGTSIHRDEAAMTWREIGIALGYGDNRHAEKVAFMVFKSAMKKIRSRPEACRRFRELVEFRNSQRRSTALPDWEV